jgi:hypothetical protein
VAVSEGGPYTLNITSLFEKLYMNGTLSFTDIWLTEAKASHPIVSPERGAAI